MSLAGGDTSSPIYACFPAWVSMWVSCWWVVVWWAMWFAWNLLMSDASGWGGGNKTKGLENQVKEHREKLNDYRSNPDKYDNKGHLSNAWENIPLRIKIITSRAIKLIEQINTFLKDIGK